MPQKSVIFTDHRRIENFDLNNITDDKRAEFYNVVFYKERTIAENNLDQRLIMTFSLKYQDYQRALRQRKLKRAEKMIDSGSYKYERDTSPRAYVSQDHTTDNGEKAQRPRLLSISRKPRMTLCMTAFTAPPPTCLKSSALFSKSLPLPREDGRLKSVSVL